MEADWAEMPEKRGESCGDVGLCLEGAVPPRKEMGCPRGGGPWRAALPVSFVWDMAGLLA